MSFQAIKNPRGRPPHQDLVTACGDGPKVIAVMLSGDVVDRLGLGFSGTVEIALGEGVDHGTLRVMRANARSTACAFTHREGNKVGINLRRETLPHATRLAVQVALPHRWIGDTLIIDLAPLNAERQ